MRQILTHTRGSRYQTDQTESTSSQKTCRRVSRRISKESQRGLWRYLEITLNLSCGFSIWAEFLRFWLHPYHAAPYRWIGRDLSTIFLCDSNECIYQMAWVYIYIWRLSPLVMVARRPDRLLSCRRRLHVTLHHQPRDSSRTTSSSSSSSLSSALASSSIIAIYLCNLIFWLCTVIHIVMTDTKTNTKCFKDVPSHKNRNTPTLTKTKRKTKTICLKDSTYAIFLKSWGYKDIKYGLP